MISLDTNVLVRFLVGDDPAQAVVAQQFMTHEKGVYIAKTTLMELEWVLRSAYGHEPGAIHAGLCALLGVSNVVVECASQVSQAMSDFAAGIDFADALHAASSQAENGLYTFDKKFVNKAKKLGRDVRLARTGGAEALPVAH